jgi:integrase
MVCLNDDEFLRVVNLEFDTSKYNMFKGVPLARDMFLFSCYTGVRYSDLIKVSNKTIQFTEEGIYFNYVAQKTGKLDSINLRNRFPVKNEMYSRPEVLILKYKELLKFLPFKIALTTYNKHLKEVAKLANISQVLSSHVARRTFATHLVDKVGLMTMSNLMQHDDPQTTIKYFDKKKRMEEARLKNISWLGNDESD